MCLELESRISELNEKIDSLVCQQNGYQIEIEERQQTIKSLLMASKYTESLTFEYEKHKEKLKSREEDLVTRLKEREARIESLEKQLRETVQSHNSENRSLVIRTVKCSNANYDESVLANQSYNSADSEIDTVVVEQSDMSDTAPTDIAILNNSNNSIVSNDIEPTPSDMKNKCSDDLQKQLDAFKKSLTEKEQQLKELHLEMEKMKSQNRQMEESHIELSDQMMEQVYKNENLNKKCRDYEVDLKNTQKVNDDLKLKIDLNEKMLKNASNEHLKSTTLASEVEVQIADLHEFASSIIEEIIDNLPVNSEDDKFEETSPNSLQGYQSELNQLATNKKTFLINTNSIEKLNSELSGQISKYECLNKEQSQRLDILNSNLGKSEAKSVELVETEKELNSTDKLDSTNSRDKKESGFHASSTVEIAILKDQLIFLEKRKKIIETNYNALLKSHEDRMIELEETKHQLSELLIHKSNWEGIISQSEEGIAKFQEQVEELQKELMKARCEKEATDEMLVRLQETRSKTEVKIDSKIQEISSLQQKNAELCKSLKEFNDVKNDVKAQKDHIYLIQQQLNEKELKIVEIEGKNVMLHENQKVLIEDKEELGNQVAELEAQVMRLKDEQGKLEEVLKIANDENVEKEKEKIILKQKIENLSQSESNLQSSSTQYKETLLDLENGKTEMKTIQMKLETQIKEYEQQLAAIKAEKIELEEKLKDVQGAMVNVEQLNDKLKLSDDKRSSEERQVEELVFNKEEFSKNYEAIRNENAELKAALGNAKMAIKSLEAERNSLQQSIKNANGNLIELREERDSLLEFKKELENQFQSKLREECEVTLAEMTIVRSQNLVLIDKMETLLSEKDELQVLLNSSVLRNEVLQKDISTLGEKLEKMRACSVEWQTKCTQAESILKPDCHNRQPDAGVPVNDIHRSRSQLDAYEDFSSMKASDLKLRIEEMLRIKNTVSVELRELESRRQKLQSDIGIYNQKIEDLKQELSREQTELERLKVSVEQAQVAQREAVQRNTPELALPKPLYPSSLLEEYTSLHKKHSSRCEMSNCFDHSRCSLTSGFPVYLYDPDRFNILTHGYDIDGFLKTTIKQTLGYNAHLVSDPKLACVYLVLVGEAIPEHELLKNNRYSLNEDQLNVNASIVDSEKLLRLPHWGGDGRNHVLINLSRRDLTSAFANLFSDINTMRAIVVQSTFLKTQFRLRFDVVVPPILGPPGGDVWQECAPMIPARRQYLLSFQGELKMEKSSMNVPTRDASEGLDNFIIEHLKEISSGPTQDKFLLQFKCVPATESKAHLLLKDWILCGTDSSRRAILKESTFALVLPPGANQVSTTLIQARIYEALRAGAIPVVLGADQLQLPYADTIEWRKLVVMLPRARITELHFLLRAISDADLLSMRRQGRLIWERFLSSVQATVDTVVASLRDRLGIPPRPIPSIVSQSVFNSSFVPLKSDPPVMDAEPEESLGPIEPAYPSPQFKRNYTVLRLQSREAWNDLGDPFYLYPHLPFDPVLPSEAKFMGSHMGFRPIGKGAGGAGKEFSEALGGNHPREQFTIVILTYEREQVLMDSLGRLYGLPYLHKVVVIWNSPKPPLDDLRWPDIGVPITVVRGPRNSLNNRFLPFDVIETEAILSVDDDAHLRHDEILFGFRVWREHRDRVVGFPGRFHAWDLNSNRAWNYNSNYSCELSMVLTGAAFVHKYYTYLYTYWLPQAIRDKVDEYMNCEDIAMNFLVSHITRKPPVKVTSRWTFRCPGCPVSLSEDDTHFQERHKCINFFSQIFGYTPLLNTQYRADSILFKTRIPHDKQKCFKYI